MGFKTQFFLAVYYCKEIKKIDRGKVYSKEKTSMTVGSKARKGGVFASAAPILERLIG